MSRKNLQTVIAQSERLASNIAKGIQVSPEDVDLLERHNWQVSKAGYAQSTIDDKVSSLHVLVFERMVGSKPPMNVKRRHHVRHIVANTQLDCRRSNINPVANSQANQCDLNVSLARNNKSGISGVHWNKRREQWRVQLGFTSRVINLGNFNDLGLAALVAITCREARAWLVSQQLNVSFNEVREYLQRVARATVASKDAADYRSLLVINSLLRNDELNHSN